MKIYIYGIIDSKGRIGESIRGLGGTPVYNIPYRDISAVISNLNEQVQNIKPDRAVIHEIVIERLMNKFTILPIRFLTVFDRKKNVISMLKIHYSDFRENLDRLRNKVEFGIRVICPADEIKETYKIDKEFEKEAKKCIAEVDNFFSGLVVEKKLEKLKSEFLLLNVSYLIEKEKQDEFRKAFERLRSSHGDFKYLFSGPWPPYNFIILKKRDIRQDFSEADMFNGVSLGIELEARK